jgi:hypothetical protein
MRHRLNIHLSSEILQQIADLASHKKLSQSAIIQAAVTSFLSPDGADRREAAFTRRLDRLTRQIQRLERNTGVTLETLGAVRALLVDQSHRRCRPTPKRRCRPKGSSGTRVRRSPGTAAPEGAESSERDPGRCR